MGLARPGDDPAVVEAQPFELRHTGPQGLEVLQGEQGLLVFKTSRYDQQMLVDDVELVQDAKVRLGYVTDRQIAVWGQERVAALVGSTRLSCLPVPIPVLGSRVQDHANQELYTAVFDDPLFGLDRLRAPHAKA